MRLLIAYIVIILGIICASSSDNLPKDAVINGDVVIYKIHTIQGDGPISTLVGDKVAIEGVVVGDFQGKDELDGFYLQEEDNDTDRSTNTSEGIFIYAPNSKDVSFGDLVRLTGMVKEKVDKVGSLSSSETQITNILDLEVNNSKDYSDLVSPASITLPLSNAFLIERYEGMLAVLPQELIVRDNEYLSRYGSVVVSANNRVPIPTQVETPGDPARSLKAMNDLNRMVIDDGSSRQNPNPLLIPGQFDAIHTLRCGDTIKGAKGVLGHRFGEYRLQLDDKDKPNKPDLPTLISLNTRTESPDDIEGTVRVVSFNVLNYFNGDGIGEGFPTDRGANSKMEFQRQRNKTLAALTGMSPDIIGLIEIENDGYGANSAIQDLVNGLNSNNSTQPNATYAFINPGLPQLGKDNITVGIIYNSQKVKPIGTSATAEIGITSSYNRQPLAQTFEEIASNENVTVVVNHLKSKLPPSNISEIAENDKDSGDGQGYFNGMRTKTANDLVAWLASDPTHSGDADYLIIGDLNSYAMEDPISAIKSKGYTDLISTHIGKSAYSYVFEGQYGYLDHALASASLAPQVANVTVWHINSDEPPALDYNVEYKTGDQINDWYNADPYRSSDHDPVIIELNLSNSTANSPKL